MTLWASQARPSAVNSWERSGRPWWNKMAWMRWYQPARSPARARIPRPMTGVALDAAGRQCVRLLDSHADFLITEPAASGAMTGAHAVVRRSRTSECFQEAGHQPCCHRWTVAPDGYSPCAADMPEADGPLTGGLEA
jgi:hypothetical protein